MVVAQLCHRCVWVCICVLIFMEKGYIFLKAPFGAGGNVHWIQSCLINLNFTEKSG